ncbi:MAG: hypothetical protein ACOZHQ_04505 [Thermodesulfobacteriota bacterium]
MAKSSSGGKGGGTKIGRDAGTGKFIPVSKAKQNPKTTVVETIPKPKKK